MTQLKVLYISHTIPPVDQPLKSVGGMQSVSVQLMQALEETEGIELMCLIQRAPWKRIGISTTIFLFQLLWEIPKAIRSFEPDIILFSSMVTAGVMPFLGKRVTVPSVAINHGQDVTLPVWIYQKYLPVVFRKLDGVISVSEATRQQSALRGMDLEKGVALPNGLDPSKSEGLPERAESRRVLFDRFGVAGEETRPLLLTVGRQVKRKGHAWFVKHVMPRLRTEVEYLVVGDGPEHETIRAQVRESGLEERVFLLGRQPDEVLQMTYAASDLFVMPNIPVPGDMEGFGIVLLEANQAGVPAVASDLEGIRDVIEQGVNGYRVPHGDADAFAAQIEQVLAGGLDELSRSAKRYVLEQFSWNRVVPRYVSFLQQVLDRKGH